MIKRTVKYVGYDGVERTGDYYFDLSEAELAEMEMSIKGGFASYIQAAIDANDPPTLMKIFKDMIMKSYGEKDPDGIHFRKSDDISTSFTQTKAYSIIFMELVTDAKKAAEFVNGIIPQRAGTQTTTLANN